MAEKNKYEDKSIAELGKLFFERGNQHLVPALQQHIKTALGKFKQMQQQNDDLFEMLIVADIDQKLFAFVTGDGDALESKDDKDVFYIAQSEEFNETMELLKYICVGNHPEGYLSEDAEVYHWISDAIAGISDEEPLAGMPITIHGGYFYGETEVDPF